MTLAHPCRGRVALPAVCCAPGPGNPAPTVRCTNFVWCDLAEAQRRTEEELRVLAGRVDQLAARMEQLTERVGQLAEAQHRTEERLGLLATHVDQLADGLQSLSARIDQLTVIVQSLARAVGSWADNIGYGLGDI